MGSTVPIIRAIRSARTARSWAIVGKAKANAIRKQMDQLTPREYQVAMLVARGLSNGEMAHQLGISLGTVKLHMHRVIHKLGVKSRSEAMLMILWEPRGPKGRWVTDETRARNDT
jgi:DNA-binding NarL/FixJ family response regulator